MSDIATRLRQCAADIRRTPVRLDTWIPLQQEAADTIDALRAEVDAFREDAANYYRVAKEADAQQAALRARVADGDVVRGDLQTVADVLRDYEGETVWQQAQAAVARVAELEADVRDARGLLRGMIDAKDGRVARFLIERAERFIERAAGNKEESRDA